VSLKTTLSSPLLVKETFERLLPNPVPLVWMRIKKVRTKEMII
jgi:hypothetical protein